MKTQRRETMTHRAMEAQIETNLLKYLSENDIAQHLFPIVKGGKGLPKDDLVPVLIEKHGVSTPADVQHNTGEVKTHYVKLDRIYEVPQSLIQQIGNTLIAAKIKALKALATVGDAHLSKIDGESMVFVNRNFDAGEVFTKYFWLHHLPSFSDPEANLPDGVLLHVDGARWQGNLAKPFMLSLNHDAGRHIIKFNATGTHVSFSYSIAISPSVSVTVGKLLHEEKSPA